MNHSLLNLKAAAHVPTITSFKTIGRRVPRKFQRDGIGGIRPAFPMQGRSIMSAIVQIARILIPSAICCGVAFADGNPRQYFSDAGRGGTPDARSLPESALGKIPLPRAEFLIPHPQDASKSLLTSVAPFGKAASDTLIGREIRSAKLARPQPALLPPNPARHGTIELPLVEPFDLPAAAASPGDVTAKWADLQARLIIDEKALAACRSGTTGCSQAAARFLSIAELGRERRGRARLGWVNRAVNLHIRPMSDWAQFGYADFWSSPLQVLNSGAGDCEDYATVKYAVLRELGIFPRDLRIVIVQDTVRQSQHAVLAVRDNNEWLILDNRTMIMLPPEQAHHYHPLFVMDYRGVRVYSAVAELS